MRRSAMGDHFRNKVAVITGAAVGALGDIKVVGLVPGPYQAVYAATRGAVIRMTESLQY